MPTPLTCLEALVGLAPEALACFAFPDGNTDWITQSSREGSAAGGVWISRLAGLNFQVLKDPASDLYDKLAKARSQAAAYVRQSILQAPKYTLGQKRYLASGQLGKAGNGSAYVGPAALSLPTYAREAGAYRVTALALQTTATVVDVVIQLDGVPVATIATNNPLQPVTPFLIPFDGAVHQLVAVGLPDGVRPLVGQLYCRTCNGNSPFATSVANSLVNITPAVSNAGFFLQVEEVCATEAADTLCYAAVHNDELADTLAQAVVGMSAYYFLFDLYATSGYNRYTLLEQKQLPVLADRFKAVADQNIAWLAQPNGLGRLQNPCYTCQPNPYAPRVQNVY
jgi:hypothetical protein